MAREKVYRFRCSDCPDCFIYEKTDLRKVPGAVLKFGERYCRGSKKVREFKRRDLKVYPPSWCPKRKTDAVPIPVMRMRAAVSMPGQSVLDGNWGIVGS